MSIQVLQRKAPGLGVLAAAVALVLGAGVPSVSAQERPAKIAVVNLDYIVAQSPAGKELQGRLDQFMSEIRGEVERRTETARDLRRRIAEGTNSLSDDKLAELQRQYEDAQIAIKRYQDDKQREGQKMQTDGLREIEKQLEPIFVKIRDEGGYDLILNNVPGVVLMAGDRIDITQKVIERLQADATAPAESGS